MLTVRVGHDTDYLTEAVAKGREGYYTGAVATGEPPGLWHGAGAEALGLSGEVDAEIMKALYTHGLDPRDPATADRATWAQAERIGNAPRNYKKADEIYAGLLEANPGAGPERRAELRAQAAQSARQAVAFYDVVLSAPKSMTLLWVACERAGNDAAAAGDQAGAEVWRQRAATVEEGLMVGHRAALDFLSEKAGYARAGHHGGGGGQWVDGHALVAAQFLQHDSRDKDPQLHVHGPVLNRVQCPDGKWRAVDGSLITLWRDGAGAVGERVAEAHVWQQLGVRWETRPDGKGRELVGVDPDSAQLFSKRTAAITPAVEELIRRFKAETGREPSGRERTLLADKATLVTRRGKVHGGETRDGQIARWAAEHTHTLGFELGEVARAVFAQDAGEPGVFTERDLTTRALALVAERGQSWTRSNLLRAISDAAPANLALRPEQVPAFLEEMADKAEAQARSLTSIVGPAGLQAKYYRADGQSVFVKPGVARFATDTQLLGEAELRAAAVRRGAPAWTVEAAREVIDRFARNGITLSPDQAAALTGVLTSGAAVEVISAPAGTGKSFLVGTLAETWPATARPAPALGEAPPGPGAPDAPQVFGVAYGQRQADVLAEEGVTARNITAWLAGQDRLAGDGPAAAADEAFRLRRGDLLVVDEAGAAPTPDLVAIHRHCEQAGAKLLLVGDPRQIGAVGPGGALADIAERGIAYELAEVRRFHHAWEGPASLRLRDGDTTAIDDYAKHGRLVDADTIEQAEAAASRSWLADTIAGRDALLIVGSNTAAARVSGALRSELVRLGRVEETGVRLGLQDTIAGVGDLVQARRNGWHLAGHAGNVEVPINRQTYRVTAIAGDGQGLTVARVLGRADGAEQLGQPMRLPADYVEHHLALAYASTVHAAHGRTVDAGYPVIGPGTDAATAYVGLTRGRETNVAYVVTRNLHEQAETGETHQLMPRTATSVLGDIVRPPVHDHAADRTALAQAEHAAQAARSTHAAIDPLLEVINEHLAGRTGRLLDQLAATGDLPAHHRAVLAGDDARGTLDPLLRRAELAGHDPATVLRDAATSESLDGSKSVAQVLHFRIRTALDDARGGLNTGIDSYRDLLPRDLPPTARAGLEALADAADTRRQELADEALAQPPQWAVEALGPIPDDEHARTEWARAAGWASSYRELADHADHADPLGIAPPAGLAERHAIFRTAHQALDLPGIGAEEEGMTEGRLRARVAAYAREENWAPRYVADELATTHEHLRRRAEDATVWAARADTEPDPVEAAQLRAAADQARADAAQLSEQITQLEQADDARSVWWIDTAVTRDNAERARYALGLRGIPLEDPAERTTATEWLEAERHAREAEDAHRDIHEHDLTPDHTHQLNVADEAAVREPADIRDSQPDVHEHDDPAERRRVPLPDDTAITVDRAEAALEELARRAAAEREAAAHAVELEPEEDARRAELARWADEAEEQTAELDHGRDDDLSAGQ